MVSPRIFPMVPCGFPMVPCGSPIVLCCFPMVPCHGAAIRHSPAQLCGLPDGAPFTAASSQRHQPIVASAALPLPCRSPGAAAVSSVPRSPALQQSLRRSAAASSSAQRSREAPFAILQLRPGQAATSSTAPDTNAPARRQPHHPSDTCVPARRQPHQAQVRQIASQTGVLFAAG